jgi:hypothetical protein
MKTLFFSEKNISSKPLWFARSIMMLNWKIFHTKLLSFFLDLNSRTFYVDKKVFEK